MKKIGEIIKNIPTNVGLYCWEKCGFDSGDTQATPEEIIDAEEEVQEEMTQRLVFGLDQLNIEDDVPETAD